MQLLMIGAHVGEDVEEELGIHLEPEEERLAQADVFKELKLPLERKLVSPLITGEFPEREKAPPEEEAAALAKLLGGIDFPKTNEEVVAYARRNRGAVADPEGVLAVLDRLPERRYLNMADVEVEVGRIL